MSTGNFENWDGDLLQIGPIYPFVGSEGLMVILCVVFWVGWHYLQFRMENRQYEDRVRDLRQGENLEKALKDERSQERM